MRNSLFLGLLILFFSCEDPIIEEEPAPVPNSLFIFDYGNLNDSRDVLVSVVYPDLVSEDLEVRFYLSNEENGFFLDQTFVEDLGESFYSVLDIKDTRFSGKIEDIITDVNGENIKLGTAYVGFVLAYNKLDPRLSTLSFPSNSVSLSSEPLQDVYGSSYGSNEINIYNPYTMLHKGTLLQNLEAPLGITYNESVNALFFLEATGSIKKYDLEAKDIVSDFVINEFFFGSGVINTGPDGNLYVLSGNEVRKYNPNSGELIEVLITGAVDFTSVNWDNQGVIYLSENGIDGDILKYSSTGEFLGVALEGSQGAVLLSASFNEISKELVLLQEVPGLSAYRFSAITFNTETEQITFGIPFENQIIGSALAVNSRANQFVTVRNTPRSGASEWKLTNFDLFTGLEVSASNRLLNNEILNFLIFAPALD